MSICHGIMYRMHWVEVVFTIIEYISFVKVNLRLRLDGAYGLPLTTVALYHEMHHYQTANI